MMLVIGIALLALLAERALSVVNLVLGWQGSLLIVFEMLSYLVPHYMGLAVPAAFFLGVFIAFSGLSRNGELDGMMAAGLGLHQLARPTFVTGLVLVVFHLVLSGYIQPFSRFAYRAAVYTVTNVSFQTLLSADVFITVGKTTYLVSSLSDDKMEFGELFLFAEDEGGDVTVTAESGEIVRDEPTQPWQLELANGIQQILPSSGPTEGNPQSLTVRFRDFRTDIDGGQAAVIRPRGEDERELTMPEILALMEDPPHQIDRVELEAEFSGRLARTLSIAFLPFLAIPLALGRKRSQRSYGMVIGILLLVIYYEIIQTGEALVDDGAIGAWLGIWAPFALFAVASSSLFFNAAFRMPGDDASGPLQRLFDRVLRQRSAR